MKLDLRVVEGTLAAREIRLTGFGAQRLEDRGPVTPQQPLGVTVTRAT